MIEKEKKSNFQRFNSPALTLGYTIMSAMLLFSFIGYQIDAKFKTQYWTLIGMFCGFIFSGYEVWKLIKREDAIEKNKSAGKEIK